MSFLKALQLDNTKVRNIKPLMKLTELTQLHISDTKVSRSQIAAIEKALPNLTVFN